MPNVDPKQIRLSKPRLVKKDVANHLGRTRKVLFVEVDIQNTSTSDLSDVTIGRKNGATGFSLVSPARESVVRLDSVNGKPDGVLKAGETRTASEYRNPQIGFRMPTFVAARQPDGSLFNHKRRPTRYWPRFTKILLVLFGLPSLAVPITTALVIMRHDEAVKPQRSPKVESRVRTGTVLMSDYTVVLDDSSTCVIPAGTRLNVSGPAPTALALNSDLASFPDIKGACEGKVKRKQKLIVPHDIIERR